MATYEYSTPDNSMILYIDEDGNKFHIPVDEKNSDYAAIIIKNVTPTPYSGSRVG